MGTVMIRLWMVLLLLAVVGPPLVAAETYYVTLGGTGSCSAAAASSGCSGGACARPSITVGISCLSSEDTLLVQNGTYTATQISDVGCNPGNSCVAPPAGSASVYTTIKAQNVHGAILRTTLSGGAQGYVVHLETAASHHISLEGFQIDVNYDGGGMHGCVFSWEDGAHDLRFRDIHCYDGQQGWGGKAMTMLVERASVHGMGGGWAGGALCTAGEPPEGKCHGIYLFPGGASSTITIRDSAFWDNNGYGLQLYNTNLTVSDSTFYDNLLGGVILISGTSTAMNNVFYNTITSPEFTRGYWPGGSPHTFVHNIITNYSLGVSFNSTANTLKNNLFVAVDEPFEGHNTSSAFTVGNMCDSAQSTCTVVSPSSTFFVDVGSANFRPHASSPVINAGVTLGAPYAVDADGAARPAGAVDIGAYEFGAVSGPVATSLVWVQQPPALAFVGQPLAPAVTVRVLDAVGAPYTASAVAVTLAKVANPGGGVLGGTLTVPSGAGGLATFGTLTFSNNGTGLQLQATAPAPITSATSNPFVVQDEIPTTLSFGTLPTPTLAGSPITPAPTVQVLNQATHIMASATIPITMGVGTGHAGGALACGPPTCTKPAVAGVATFDTLSFGTAAAVNVLRATSPGLTLADSPAFAITPTVTPAAPTDVTVSTGFFLAR